MTIVKGKALRQDFAQYDGITLTGSRKDSTGGFISGLRVGDEVDVLMVYGQGENRTNQTIQNAITSIGSKNVTLKFTPGTWAINADVTIPSNLSVSVPAGVVFNVASGKTLTFQGPVFRDSETWTSGSGTVTETWSRSEGGAVTFNGTVTFGGSLVGLRVTNLQALRDAAASILSVGVAFALGHTTAGDGGHGEFRYVSGASAGTYTDDDGITIVPTGGNGSAAWLRVYSGEVNIKWFGAAGDGTTDDTSARDAVISLGGEIFFPEGTYLITGGVTVTKPTRLVGEGMGKTVIKANVGAASVKLFSVTTDDFSASDLTIDGSANTSTLTGNQYAFFSGDGSTKYYRHHYKRVEIVDFINSTDKTPIYSSSSPVTSHAIYIDNVDIVSVEHCDIANTLGAAVFARDVDLLIVENNRLKNNYWYPVNLEAGVTRYTIRNNRFDQNFSEGVYWGGSVNVVSQVGESLCKYGVIADNDFSGKHSYGGVIRLQSAWDVDVCNNTIHDIAIGSQLPSATQTMTAIRVVTRGTSTASQSGPSQNIRIHHNTIHPPADNANLDERQAIYIDNQFQSSRTPVIGIWVYDNKITSTSSTVFWENGVLFHGRSGGVEDVWIQNNYIEVFLRAGSIVGGAIGLVATDSTGLVDRVYIGGNTIIEKGTPASSVHVGISIGAFVDNVVNTSANFLSNLFYGVRTLTNAGPTLNWLNDQIFDGITDTELLAGVALTRFAPTRTGYVTVNDGTATVANGTTSIAVTHGLSKTPNLQDISVTPTNNLGTATKFWVSGATSTQFTINVDADPGATTATFVWSASIQ